MPVSGTTPQAITDAYRSLSKVCRRVVGIFPLLISRGFFKLRRLFPHYAEGALKSTVAISRKDEISSDSPRMHGNRVSFHVVGDGIACQSHHCQEGFAVSKFNRILAINVYAV